MKKKLSKVENQSEEFKKYHTDEFGIKKGYEEIFHPDVFNKLPAEEQLEIVRQRFPIGLKVLPNTNQKPFEIGVLGYEVKEDGIDKDRNPTYIVNVLTNENELRDNWTFGEEGNTSAHPGWFYPVEPVRLFTLKEILNPIERKENLKDDRNGPSKYLKYLEEREEIKRRNKNTFYTNWKEDILKWFRK